MRLRFPSEKESGRVNSLGAFHREVRVPLLPRAFLLHMAREEQILRPKTRCHAQAVLPITGLERL